MRKQLKINTGKVVVQKQQVKKKSRRSRVRNPKISTHKFALSRVNPFLPEVAGVRVPDDYGYPTGTGICRTAVVMSSNSGGYMCSGFTPFITSAYQQPLSVTAGTVVWTGGTFNNPMPQSGALGNLSSTYRVVSWGLRLSGETSLTNASGHIWVAHVPINLSTTFPYYLWPTTEGMIDSLPLSEKFSLVELCERPVVVSGRQFDDSAFRFRGQSAEQNATGNAVESTDGWSAIVLFGAGLPASLATLNVEIVMHVEFNHNSTSTYGFIDTIMEPYNLQVIAQAANMAHSAPIACPEDMISTIDRVVETTSRIARVVVPIASAASKLSSSLGRQFAKLGLGNSSANTPFRIAY